MDTILLEIKNIKGNAMIDQHKDSIIIDSFSHSLRLPLTQDPANSERTLGRPAFSEFQITKTTDQSTSALYAACAAGTKLGDATILVGRNQSGKFMLQMKYVLSNAMVSSINTSGGGMLADSFTLNFTKITSEYTQQNADSTKKGNASFGWDLVANKAAAAPKS